MLKIRRAILCDGLDRFYDPTSIRQGKERKGYPHLTLAAFLFTRTLTLRSLATGESGEASHEQNIKYRYLHTVS